jgi:hypothetical protein
MTTFHIGFVAGRAMGDRVDSVPIGHRDGRTLVTDLVNAIPSAQPCGSNPDGKLALVSGEFVALRLPIPDADGVLTEEQVSELVNSRRRVGGDPVQALAQPLLSIDFGLTDSLSTHDTPRSGHDSSTTRT